MNPRLQIGEDGVGSLVFNDPARVQNILTDAVLDRLEGLVAEAEKSAETGALRALVLRSDKPGSFVAGADMAAIARVAADGDSEAGRKAARRGQSIFGRIAALPVPTVAAVRGVCLGGGAEIALACDYRVASKGTETRIGFPEVQLGILPGWGGTTRLPRLIGLRAALSLLLTGRPVRVSKAENIGLVDRVFPEEQFEERSLDFARGLIPAPPGLPGSRKRKRGPVAWFLDGTPPGRALVFRMARNRLHKGTGGHYPAPFKILDVVRAGLGRPLTVALELEAKAVGMLLVSPVCRNLLFLFRLRESARKGPWTKEGRPARVNRMAVVGAGVMGGGIAQAAAYRDIPVRMKDLRHEAVSAGLAFARSIFDGAVKRGQLRRLDAKRKMALISGGLDDAGIRHADLVVEAVVERMAVKKAVLREVEAVANPVAVLATNTSSLSVDDMASVLNNPGRFAGMHFFNPVHRMPLVEVVRGKETDPATVESIAALAVRLGKVPVVTRDRPGFLVNRILGSCLNEAGHMLDEGVDAPTTEEIWTRFGMPMGPYRLMDEVGIDVVCHAGRILGEALGDRMAPAAALVALGESGRLGRKGGRGFYRYEAGRRKGFDRTVYSDMGLRPSRSSPGPDAIRDRLVLAMINEAGRVLEEGVVRSAGAVDLGLVLGTGFPPFRGGLLKYADDRGIAQVLNGLKSLRDRLGARYEPCRLVAELGETGGTFHGAFPQPG